MQKNFNFYKNFVEKFTKVQHHFILPLSELHKSDSLSAVKDCPPLFDPYNFVLKKNQKNKLQQVSYIISVLKILVDTIKLLLVCTAVFVQYFMQYCTNTPVQSLWAACSAVSCMAKTT